MVKSLKEDSKGVLRKGESPPQDQFLEQGQQMKTTEVLRL